MSQLQSNASNRIAHLTSHLCHGTSTTTTAPKGAAGSAKNKPSPVSIPEILPFEKVVNFSVEDLRNRYGMGRPDGIRLDGLNHIAFVSSDMARTVWFWCEVLGMRLSKTLQLPGNGQHFFIEGGRGCAIAYFYFPDAPKQTPGISTVDMSQLMKSGSYSTAHGSVNHTAFNVPQEKLREYRARVKAANVGFVSPILYHSDVEETGYSPTRDENTTWESFYFVGVDGEYLEMTAQIDRPFTPARDLNHLPFSPTRKN